MSKKTEIELELQEPITEEPAIQEEPLLEEEARLKEETADDFSLSGEAADDLEDFSVADLSDLDLDDDI